MPEQGGFPKRRRLRRILIDCTLIDFNRQPTGIPRVTGKYIEEGYRWGRSRGIEVVPVLPTANGLWVVRPLPSWLSADHASDLVGYLGTKEHGVQSGAPARRSGALRRGLDHLPFARWMLPAAAETRDTASAQADAALIEVSDEDVLFCPAYWHDVDPEIYRTIKRAGAFVVTLVHDLLPMLFKECYPDPWKQMFKDNVFAALRYDDMMFTVSGYTMSVVKELCWRHRIECPPLAVAYNGFEPLLDPAIACATDYFGNKGFKTIMTEGPAPYIMVGSIEPKKAHIPVIQCFEALWEAGFARPLVIIGRRGWMDEGILWRIRNSSHFSKNLFWFDTLDDCDLVFGYEQSRGLIFASLGEGFGIPMIEAAYHRRPAIVYDTEIAREVLGDAGLYFTTMEEFVDNLLWLEDDARHREATETAARIAWPTWAQLAPSVYDAIEAAFLAARSPVSLPRLSERTRSGEGL